MRARTVLTLAVVASVAGASIVASRFALVTAAGQAAQPASPASIGFLRVRDRSGVTSRGTAGGGNGGR